jgi:predicted acyl esterase
MTDRKASTKTLTGVFDDSPVQGLDFRTQSLSGITNAKGEFRYKKGEAVTFAIGGLVLGATPGDELITPAHLVLEVGGDVKRLRNQKITNIGRFIQSLDAVGNIERGIRITKETADTVRKFRYKINFDQPEEAFTQDPDVVALFSELKLSLRSPAQARNHLRRTLYGIRKLTDVKIPTRDGSYLTADIFRPIAKGRYPVIMSLGGYGKAFWLGVICDEKALQEKEELEDDYFEANIPQYLPTASGATLGPPVKQQQTSECFETANSVDWVPRGYVVIRVDGRGVGKSPGIYEQFSLNEAKDFYDAIEWAGKQEWSNGNVGLWGASYYAMNAYNVAQLQPPHLKAMVCIGGDIDSYQDYIYTGGGLYNSFNFQPKQVCGEWKGVDWIKIALENPFNEPKIYGPKGRICISPDMDKVTVPFWSIMGTEQTIHARGSSEAFIRAASKHKKLTVLSEAGIHYQSYAKNILKSDMAFFDYWLKGVRNDIMKQPPVRVMVRTGWGGYFWQDEKEWPIARTKYRKYFLNATPSVWTGDGRRNDFKQLQTSIPGQDAKVTYSADVKWSIDPPWSYGASFVTEPLPEDMLMAGYAKVVLWVSSTSYDMQLFCTLRVSDENNMDVSYAVGSPTMNRLFPVVFGALKVSHRKLDPLKSTAYRPWHTHRKADYQPLKPGEIVESEVELWPTTALIKKGWRIRLNVQPAQGEGLIRKVWDPLDDQYLIGATNTIYTGPKNPSYLQLPVIPPK